MSDTQEDIFDLLMQKLLIFVGSRFFIIFLESTIYNYQFCSDIEIKGAHVNGTSPSKKGKALEIMLTVKLLEFSQ